MNLFRKPEANQGPPKVRVIPREQHSISRQDLSENALKVLYRLSKAGYEAYLVGGCVRDALLGIKPKDFDVVTNATPEEIKALFRNCRLIGRRFRLAHIVFGREIIEVATFRGHHQDAGDSIARRDDKGQLLRDNVYGTIDEDAQRRDFSLNALYYNIKDFAIYDYADGLNAIEQRKIEMIGDPESRFKEDPVRMIRAVRFATKLDMQIEEKTAAPIKHLAHLLGNIPAARLFEETLKLTLAGKAEANFKMLTELGLFQQLFPMQKEFLKDPDSKESELVLQVFKRTDQRINQGRKITPAYLFAALGWYPLEQQAEQYKNEGGLNHFDAMNLAMNDIQSQQNHTIMVPKRFSIPAREIWQLQLRFGKRAGKRAYRLLEHPRFRAAYDFLQLRGEIEGGDVEQLADWWVAFHDGDEKTRHELIKQVDGGHQKRRRRFNPKKRRTPKQSPQGQGQ